MVKEAGGTAYKFTSPGRRSVPDRLVLWPCGIVDFVELKAPGQKPTPLQEREHEKLREQSPENPVALFTFGHTYLVLGDARQARASLDAVPDGLRTNYFVRLHEALLLAVEGKAPQALAMLDRDLLKFAEMMLRPIGHVPEIYAVAGKPEEALDWLDRSVRRGDERAEWFERNPLLENVRREPRFAHLLESIRYRLAQRQAGPARERHGEPHTPPASPQLLSRLR